MSEEIIRLMPPRLNLGTNYNTTMGFVLTRKREIEDGTISNVHGYREILGFFLPTWQRGLVWSREQQIALLESAWKGISLGTFSYNTASIGHALDNILIDGQQRMAALEAYFNDEFPVFGYKWSEVSKYDQRDFKQNIHFASYETKSEDEEYLKGYYNLMNFGGVKHKDDERAI